jgi:hypothetical protein
LDSIFNHKQSVLVHVPQNFENVPKQVIDAFGNLTSTLDKNILYLGLSLENEFTLKNLERKVFVV